MEEQNRVAVKIYGQDYIISGQTSKEHIMRVADYVDSKMREIAAAMPQSSPVSLAVLSAVNAADDYFDAAESLHVEKQKNAQLTKDADHYVELWEEAKQNFVQYKQEVSDIQRQKDELQQTVTQKTVELTNLSNVYTEMEKKLEQLKQTNLELEKKLEHQEGSRSENSALVKELEAKCKDVESSFFDLQMENIQLKGELDRLKKAAERVDSQ